MSDLLMVMADPPAGNEDAFNQWYDEHASARLTVPGIESAQRYVGVPGTRPAYMAWYDLESTKVLDTPDYLALRSNRPPGEQEMLDSLPAPPDRRIYRAVEEFENSGYTADAATHSLAVWMSSDQPDDLDAWYRDEHVPLLFEAPGWLRCRRFDLVSGDGSRFLALHDLANAEVVDDPRAEKARHTEWRDRVVAARTSYERRLYRLMRRF